MATTQVIDYAPTFERNSTPMWKFPTLDEADLAAHQFNEQDPDWTYEARPYLRGYALGARDEDGYDLGWL